MSHESDLRTRRIIGAVCLVMIFLGYRFIMYGSVFSSCIYNEEAVSVPIDLKSTEIIFTEDARVSRGKDPYFSCLPQMGKVLNEIVPHDSTNDSTITAMYTERGLKLERLAARSRVFRVHKVFAVKQGGITTIGSGPGPIHHLILSDEAGVLYRITPVLMAKNGEPRNESSIAVARFNSKEYKITPDNFISYTSGEAVFEWKLF